ncbi:GEVED domain-containing protein [Luteibaculum oceani]|uniref:T9SS type A sorting domain-containing protein n=1 Tax=Luteibaculum oceani TaxID=1294296 RepID=A0A5C6VBR0_9FLAO|nr:GEVED domain-containing protein [Luteibaculum oceani]TXC82131.1 T9SS type A sorting domain-containing protein [Luteibaculum oceani]
MKKLIFTLFTFFIVQFGFGQNYCSPSYSSASYYISQVRFGTGSAPNGWTNNTGYNSNGYGNFTGNSNYRADVEPCKQYDLRITSNSGATRDFHVKVYFDWNDDGDFNDSGELLPLGTRSGDPYVWNGQFVVPPSAKNVDTRMRVVLDFENTGNYNDHAGPCEDDTWGEAEDYRIKVGDADLMTFENITAVQNTTAPAPKGSNNTEIIGINVKTADCTNPLKVRSMNFGKGDSENLPSDATNAKLFYTGGSASFSTNSQVGGVATPANTFTISGIDGSLPELLSGDNWFWLTYDVPAGATVDNHLDAELLSVNMDTTNASNVVITTSNTDPTGKRLIVNSYCAPTPANEVGARIDRIRISNLDNQTNSNGLYTSFVATLPAFDFCVGNEHSLTVNWHTDVNYINGSVPFFIHAYFDWNRDGDFNDPDEHYFVGNERTRQYPLDGVKTGNFAIKVTPPQSALPGPSVMRIQVGREPDSNPCLGTIDGETEDYGYNLLKLGELSATPDILCKKDSVLLDATKTTGNYTFQFSTDRINFTDISSASANSGVYSSVIDTTTIFRLFEADMRCPDGGLSSDLVDVPFVGVSSITSDKSQLCLGDSANLNANYEYRTQEFTETPGTGNTTVIGLRASTFQLPVSGLPYNGINTVALNSVCINGSLVSGADRSFFYLYPPNSNKKVLLSEGNGAEHPAGTSETFCFTDKANTAVTSESNAFNGNYRPEEPLSRLNGTNPNGTWTLMVYNDYTDGAVEINEFTLNFGTNSEITWTPNSNIDDINSDTPEVTPTSSTTYIASLTNDICSPMDSVEITVLDPSKVITVDITEVLPTGIICSGDLVTFKSSLSESVANAPLQWFINDFPVSGETNETFNSNTLSDGDEVKVTFNLLTQCGTFSSADSVVVNISNSLAPSLTLNIGSQLPVCEGATVNFTANDKDFGPNPIYKWFLNGTQQSNSGKTYSSNTLVNNDTVVVEVSTTYPCVSVSSLRDTLVVKTTTELDPKIELTSDVNPELSCLGNTINFVADTVFNNSGGKGTVTWFHNGTQLNISSMTTSSDTFSTGNHLIRVEYNVNSGCTKSTFVTDQIAFEVGDDVVPGITIKVDRDKVCKGELVTFSVDQIENGGSAPEIQWFKNGDPVSGQTGMTYSSNSFKNQDEITARLISSIECVSFEQAFSGSKEVKISERTQTEINIISPFESTPFCEGTDVRVEVDLLFGGGVEPNIEWFLNDKSIQKRKFQFISLDSLKHGDRVYAKLHPNSVCPTPALPTSDTLTFEVNPTPFVDFQAVQVEGGLQFIPNSQAFENYNWSFGTGQTSDQITPVYQYENTGVYRVCLDIQDENGCVNTRCKDVNYTVVSSIAEAGELSFTYFPNPVGNELNIELNTTVSQTQITVVAADGKTIKPSFKKEVLNGKTIYRLDTDELSSGLYMVHLVSKDAKLNFRFEKL